MKKGMTGLFLSIVAGCAVATVIVLFLPRQQAGALGTQQQLALAVNPPAGSATTSRLPGPVNINADLRAALDALTIDDAQAAIAIRDTMKPGLARRVLSFAIAVSGLGAVSAEEIDRTRRELAGWQELQTMRRLEEHAVFKQKLPADAVISILGETRPETAEGGVALAKAFVQSGQIEKAEALIRDLWRNDIMYVALEDRIMADFPTILTTQDDKARMVMLLFAERQKQASRFAVRAKAEPLFEAFSAVLAKSPDAGKRIAAAEKDFGAEPALLYARIRNFRQKQRYSDAAGLLATIPTDSKVLVNPAEWWDEQRIVSRALAKAGKNKAAYDIVNAAVADTPTDRIEAAFHAGWYALRKLKKPERAVRHFSQILQISERPIALSRGFYWLGRAAEAGGPGDAKALYAKAAVHAGTFYGQLAAARLKSGPARLSEPLRSPEQERHFYNRDPVRAISLLRSVGHGHRALRIIRALAEDISSSSDMAMLGNLALQMGGQPFALEIGKTAYGRGMDVPTLAWPIGAIPDTADTSGSGTALAYAVARQESGFNPAARSPANALGLLQLLPTTAQHVAGRHKMTFSKDLLTSDPAYNATLGAHYLGEQITDFKGSYILTLVAYNAGPARVRQWIKRYGDPRGKPVEDVVDWIENIPFSETRGYVQRVMENYQVYKARLGDPVDIERDLTFGRAP